MNAGELTTVVGSITALFSSAGFIAYMNKRKAPSVASVAVMIREERDRLQERLDKLTEEYDRKIAAIKADSEAAIAEVETKRLSQQAVAQAQIDQLQREVDSLYRRLYQMPPP